MKRLSIVIPAYNEEKFISRLLTQVLAVPTEELGYEKEVILVDDGSKDRTFEEAKRFASVKCFKQVPNQGKGRAVQRGVAESTGDYILVQDADLEYDPKDYLPMLKALGQRNDVAIYGSRTLGLNKERSGLIRGRHQNQGIGPWAAGVVLSAWTWTLYRQWITDTLTAYKIYPAQVLKSFAIQTHGFETDHEITAKLIRAGISIEEVPISYEPRSREEGKKIRFQDGLIALWTLARFRV